MKGNSRGEFIKAWPAFREAGRGYLLLLFSAAILATLQTGCKTESRSAESVSAVSKSIPEQWMEDWRSPSLDQRPLQIVHGMDIRNRAKYLKDSCGLGGVVCNVKGEDYLNSEEAWSQFVEGVRSMREHDLRVWIYDEDGYPSLSAGGRVLEGHPGLESLEMVFDRGNTPRFHVRSSYEFTHACNNFCEARRYPNPLDAGASERFIELTHEAYLKHLGPELYGEVEAFFTDEPSLLAVNLGQLAEEVRNRVSVMDSIDTSRKSLPAIPWVEDLYEKYSARYNEDLEPHLSSLFEGDSQKDKEIRQKYWSLIEEVFSASYYEPIRDWCDHTRAANQNRGPLSSGHGLREESLLMHVPVDGNKLQALTGLDIPGLDYLNSEPASWMRTEEEFLGGWQAAALPTSVAQLTGKRLVMCEMSDFMQKLAGEDPATLEEMQASTAWQMAGGVTEFTLYYGISQGDEFPYRNESAHKAYCDFVGRINALVRDAYPVKNTLLYYPVYDMQREYQPTALPADFKTQNEKVEQIESSFNQLGVSLSMAHIPFVLIDYIFLEKARITGRGTLSLGGREYSSMVLPSGIKLPPPMEAFVDEMKENGISVLHSGGQWSPGALIAALKPEEQIFPDGNKVAFGHFTRSGRTLYLLVNTGKGSYNGHLSVGQKGKWLVLDPQTGTTAQVSSLKVHDRDALPLELEAYQSMIFISE